MELKDWITVAATLVIAFVGWCVTNAIQKSQKRLKYIEIAVGILDKPPSLEKRTIREWAIQVMGTYSEVPIDDKMKEELRKYPIIAPITATLNKTLDELKLTADATIK